MKTYRILLLAFVLLFACASPAMAAPAQPEQKAAPAEEAKPLWTPSPAVTELGEQLQTLVGETADLEPQETFGTRALGFMMTFIDVVRQESVALVNSFAALPQLRTWYDRQVTTPRLMEFWRTPGVLVAQALGAAALLVGVLAELLLAPLRHRLRGHRAMRPVARLMGRLGWLALALVPVVLFVGAASEIIKEAEATKPTAYVVMALVTALALMRLIRISLRFFSPRRRSSIVWCR